MQELLGGWVFSSKQLDHQNNQEFPLPFAIRYWEFDPKETSSIVLFLLTILISLSPSYPALHTQVLAQCPGTKCLPNALYLVISGALIAAFLSVLASFVIDFVYLRDQCHLLVYKILYFFSSTTKPCLFFGMMKLGFLTPIIF